MRRKKQRRRKEEQLELFAGLAAPESRAQGARSGRSKRPQSTARHTDDLFGEFSLQPTVTPGARHLPIS